MIATITAAGRGLHVSNVRAAPSGATGCYTAVRMSPAPTRAPAMTPACEQPAERRGGDRPPTPDNDDIQRATVETSTDVQPAPIGEKIRPTVCHTCSDSAPLLDGASGLALGADVSE